MGITPGILDGGLLRQAERARENREFFDPELPTCESRNPKPETRNPNARRAKADTRTPGLPTYEPRNPEPESRNWPGAPNTRPDTRNTKHETRTPGVRFRGGLVFKAHRLLYYPTLGLRVIKKKKKPETRNLKPEPAHVRQNRTMQNETR